MIHVSGFESKKPMNGRLRTILLLSTATSLVAGSAGCKNTTVRRDDVGTVPVASNNSNARLPAELPANKASLVCKATAEELDKHGRFEQAIAQYQRARQYDPSIPGVSHRLALLYDRTGQSTKAAEEFQRAYRESPNNAGLLNDLGFYHYRRNNLDQAEVALRRAVKLDETNKRAWTNLALVLGEARKYKESYQAFVQAGGEATAQSNLGIILARHGDRKQATQLLRQSIAQGSGASQSKAALAVLADDNPGDGRVRIQRVSHTANR